MVCRGLILVGLLCCFACDKQKEPKLRIATAANMQFVIKDLTAAFTAETGIPCEVIIGSSGKLTAQIQQGAPFDVFVSADTKYPNVLFDHGLTRNPPKVYAFGQLILWTLSEGLPPNMEQLSNSEIKHIALANPKTAPYGFAAIEALKYHQLLDRVESKLVYGESIAQTNQFVTTHAAQIGLTSQSVVYSAQMKGKGHWTAISKESYAPIAQGMVLLKNGNVNLAYAKQFDKFLFSATAKEILTNFGYNVSISEPLEMTN